MPGAARSSRDAGEAEATADSIATRHAEQIEQSRRNNAAVPPVRRIVGRQAVGRTGPGARGGAAATDGGSLPPPPMDAEARAAARRAKVPSEADPGVARIHTDARTCCAHNASPPTLTSTELHRRLRARISLPSACACAPPNPPDAPVHPLSRRVVAPAPRAVSIARSSAGRAILTLTTRS